MNDRLVLPTHGLNTLLSPLLFFLQEVAELQGMTAALLEENYA